MFDNNFKAIKNKQIKKTQTNKMSLNPNNIINV